MPKPKMDGYKYQRGDEVRLANGNIGVITGVKPSRPKYPYSFTVEGSARKCGEAFITEKIGDVDVDAMLADIYAEKNAKGREYAEQQANLHGNTPTGQRWSIVATKGVGEEIMINDRRGKGVTMTLVEVNTRARRYPIIAQKPTGGTYKYEIEAVVLPKPEDAPSESVADNEDAPDEFRELVSTVGDLHAALELMLEAGYDPNAKVLVAGDAECNTFNTLGQIDADDDGVFIFVNHDNILADEIF